MATRHRRRSRSACWCSTPPRRGYTKASPTVLAVIAQDQPDIDERPRIVGDLGDESRRRAGSRSTRWPAAASFSRSRMYGPGGFIEAGKEWPALLRQLERVDGTSYRQ